MAACIMIGMDCYRRTYHQASHYVVEWVREPQKKPYVMIVTVHFSDSVYNVSQN